MGLMQMLFGKKEPIDMENSFIIDVRSSSEFAQGHAPGSKNIPLNELPSKMNTLPKDKQIVACCASGMRSGSAVSMLQKAGFKAYNAGSWVNLK